ncbi:hypothetical protein KUTeg_001594 [Tegillarca granosa]|uniref:Transmembrane protein n=1 Tax=Tegillarca granosa TaxID=220873 RepID=A0ABQ9FVI5_TEGGR|nr:hypothetical protein KUTeg_001594 [Tegillarca granosa]
MVRSQKSVLTEPKNLKIFFFKFSDVKKLIFNFNIISVKLIFLTLKIMLCKFYFYQLHTIFCCTIILSYQILVYEFVIVNIYIYCFIIVILFKFHNYHQ